MERNRPVGDPVDQDFMVFYRNDAVCHLEVQALVADTGSPAARRHFAPKLNRMDDEDNPAQAIPTRIRE